MHPALRMLVNEIVTAAVAAVMIVLMTAFLKTPPSLGRNPGESYRGDREAARHMT